MPDGLEFPGDIFPDPGFLAALRKADTPAARASLVERLRPKLERSREVLRAHLAAFERLYEEATRGRQATEDALRHLDRIAEQWQRMSNEHRERREAFERELTSEPGLGDPEICSLITDELAIGDQLLGLYPTARARLLELAGEGGMRTLRARPVEGEIDHAALSREFMERFPKIRAALAQ